MPPTWFSEPKPASYLDQNWCFCICFSCLDFLLLLFSSFWEGVSMSELHYTETPYFEEFRGGLPSQQEKIHALDIFENPLRAPRPTEPQNPPPQFLKKRSENAGANENISCGFPSLPGIAPGVAPRIMVFVLLKSWHAIPRMEFRIPRAAPRAAPRIPQNSPRAPRNSDGLFTPRAFFLKLGWSPGFLWVLNFCTIF